VRHLDLFRLRFLPFRFSGPAEYNFIRRGDVVALYQPVGNESVGDSAGLFLAGEVSETHRVNAVILPEVECFDTFGLKPGGESFGIFYISECTHLNGVTHTGNAGGFCGWRRPGDQGK